MAEPLHKMLAGGLKKVAAAQEHDLQAIQALALPGATVNAEDVLIGSAKVAHDQHDRSNERFPKSYLDRFAETLPGKSLLTGHDYSKAPAGRWFDAEVRPDPETGGSSLYGKFYVDAKSEMARQIQLGIAKDVSIGFRPDTLHCDGCNKEVSEFRRDDACQHQKATYGGDVQKVEAMEGSLVWLGCQPGAQVMGQSSPLYQRKMALAQAAQEDDMELKEALQEIERLKPLAEQAENYTQAAGKYEAFLRAEIRRKTEVKELTASRDADAAKKAVAFVGKMSAYATIEQLEEMNADLDEQLKTVLATKGSATPLDSAGGTMTKRQPWEPRTRVQG
jgi:hypothetical protein